MKSRILSIAFYLLTILLAATPILVIANGALAQHAVALAAAISLATAAMGPEAQITSIVPFLKRFHSQCSFQSSG